MSCRSRDDDGSHFHVRAVREVPALSKATMSQLALGVPNRLARQHLRADGDATMAHYSRHAVLRRELGHLVGELLGGAGADSLDTIGQSDL